LPEDSDETSYTKRWDASSASNIAKFTTFVACNPAGGNQDYNVVDNDPNGVTFGDLWEYIGEYFGVPVTTQKGYDANEDVECKLQKGVWRDIVAKHGGDVNACESYGTWWFFQFQMAITFQTHVSMEKAERELGWTTKCDTRKELGRIFDSMKAAGVLPSF
jgi:nucleoside-diphosphate-sugar epimerase